MAKKKKPGPKVEREMRTIRKPIDDARRAELAYEMARVTKDITHERDEKASEMKVYNDHLKALEARMRRLADDVEEGQEDVEVDVVVTHEFDKNQITYRDAITDEVVDSRALTAEERESMEQLTIKEIEEEP